MNCLKNRLSVKKPTIKTKKGTRSGFLFYKISIPS